MTATAPELSKSDFFDFVTSHEITDAQYKQQMRQVNVFMESPDSRSNPLLSDEPKEQNNNLLTSATAATMATATTSTTLQSFDSIWNVDRDRDRLESAMLEDLNKYYWTQDTELTGAPHCDTAISNKLISNNTDGQIYTLTVLNQDMSDASAVRYWPKEEDVSMSSPAEIEPAPSLDFESILTINDFAQDSLATNMLPKVENYNYEEGETENNELSTSTTIKVEPYNYDEIKLQSNEKSENSPNSIPTTIISAPIIESQVEFNNNNNDWKLSDQNAESNESLLRSALQGKAFSLRYSTPQSKSIAKLDVETDIKKAIITNNNKADVPSMYADSKNGELDFIMSISPTDGNVNISILLDESNASVASTRDPTSTLGVDEILSQLDNTYHDDYEKLNKIATELGESVQPYCTVEPLDPTRNVYNIHHVNGELVTMIPAGEMQLQQHLQIVPASPSVTSTKPSAKKYKRVQNKSSPPSSQSQSGTAIQPATSTSNGVRKERSLHYCSICSKGFKDKYSVNVHVRTHTGEKPFSCSLCGKSFRQKAHLAKHYQTHIAQKAASANGALKTNKQR